MSRQYCSVDDVKKMLQVELEVQRAYLAAWQQVKILKKKDGSDFQNRKKTFEGASWEIESYSDDLHPVLKVYTRESHRGYISQELYMYVYTDEMSDDDPRKNQGKNYSSWSRKTYILTPEEAMQRIQEHIKHLHKDIDSITEQLDNFDKIYNSIKESFYQFSKVFKESCEPLRSNPKYPSMLEYALLELMGVESWAIR